MEKLIDCYGHPASSERYQKFDYAKRPYMVAEADGATYMCFSKAAKRPIHRYTEADGVTKCEWAFGAWEDRANLSYTATLNDAIAVNVEDLED